VYVTYPNISCQHPKEKFFTFSASIFYPQTLWISLWVIILKILPSPIKSGFIEIQDKIDCKMTFFYFSIS
jgi:hypothetical protein